MHRHRNQFVHGSHAHVAVDRNVVPNLTPMETATTRSSARLDKVDPGVSVNIERSLLSTHLPHLLDEREAQAASVRLTQSKALRTEVASPVSTNPVSRKAMLIPSGREVSKSTPRTSATGNFLSNWTRMRRRQVGHARTGIDGEDQFAKITTRIKSREAKELTQLRLITFHVR